MQTKTTEPTYIIDFKNAKELIINDNFTNPYNTDDMDELIAFLSNCTVKDITIHVRGDDAIENQSLLYIYSPKKYSYRGNALIECHNRKFELTVFDAKRFMLAEMFEDGRNAKITFPHDLRRSDRVMNVVEEILALMDAEKQKMQEKLHNTKNFGSRVHVAVEGIKCYVYAECFAPETQEYYQLEGFLGSYRVSMSHNSLFMKQYLRKDYGKYYTKELDKIFASYKSLAEVVQAASNEPDNEKQEIWKQRVDCLRNLETEICKVVSNIAERKIFIGCPREDISQEDLLVFYRLKKKFKCVTRKETVDFTASDNKLGVDEPKIKLQVKNYKITTPRLNSIRGEEGVEITLDDLYRAIELGIDKVRTVYELKKKYGSLDAVLAANE